MSRTMTATSTASTTLQLYWKLASAKKDERLDASVNLLSALDHFQAGFTPAATTNGQLDSDETSSDEDENAEYTSYSAKLDQTNATDVAYAIRRLIRGLASSRESSRLGFAVALTEVCCNSFTECA